MEAKKFTKYIDITIRMFSQLCDVDFMCDAIDVDTFFISCLFWVIFCIGLVFCFVSIDFFWLIIDYEAV